jgi:hypothetical protein
MQRRRHTSTVSIDVVAIIVALCGHDLLHGEEAANSEAEDE